MVVLGEPNYHRGTIGSFHRSYAGPYPSMGHTHRPYPSIMGVIGCVVVPYVCVMFCWGGCHSRVVGMDVMSSSSIIGFVCVPSLFLTRYYFSKMIC